MRRQVEIKRGLSPTNRFSKLWFDFVSTWQVFTLVFSLAFTQSALAGLEDSTDFDLQIVDGAEYFKKHLFLRDQAILRGIWVDNTNILVKLIADDTSSDPNKSRLVVINTDSGEVKDTEFLEYPSCFSGGQVIFEDKAYKQNRKIYYGEFGGVMQSMPISQFSGKFINRFDCRISNSPLQPNGQPWGKVPGSETYLKTTHGRIVSQETLKEGVVVSHLYLEQILGKVIDIPTNPGESNLNFKVKYIPFEDAYLLTPEFNGGGSRKHAGQIYPLFVRLLYPDGFVKRFLMPNKLLSKIKNGQLLLSDVVYTKRGMLWTMLSRNKKSDSFETYLETDKKLLKIDSNDPSPDGCKLIGHTASAKTLNRNLENYYILNICEGIIGTEPN